MPPFETYRAELLFGPFNNFERKHSPETVYVRGDTSILQSGGRVSIVGARKASREGTNRATKLARWLTRHGVVVVSGLAMGIDAAAHRGAIDSGGRTIGVIGTPIGKAYPRQNAALQEEIAQKHLLVSQFPVGMKTQRFHFPQRNRTMALVSDATVIIEASDSSGSLSQGWEALRLGRSLFIAQSVVDREDLSWPKEMQRYGADVLNEDTFEDLLASLPPRDPTLTEGAFAELI